MRIPDYIAQYIPAGRIPRVLLGTGITLGLFALIVFLAVMSTAGRTADSDYTALEYRSGLLNYEKAGETSRRYLKSRSVSSGGAPGKPSSAPAQLVPIKAPVPGAGEERKLIHRAAIRMRVADLDAAGAKVREMTTSLKGYIARERFEHGTTSRKIVFKLRIPRGEFKASLARLDKLSEHTSYRTIRVDDVTEKFVDMGIRLKAKRATEEQYLKVLRRARKVSEILEVRKKIGEIRAEIETIQGRLRFLSNQVQFSTIDLTIYVYAWTPGEERGFITRLLRGITGGWRGLLSVIIGVISTWPLWLLGGTGFFWLRKYLRNRKQKGKDNTESSES